jgi:hypothetical protein
MRFLFSVKSGADICQRPFLFLSVAIDDVE